MSRIGKLPITVPAGVTASVEGGLVKVKGPKGELSFTLTDEVVGTLENGAITVKPATESQRARAMWGMSRTQIANMVEGVTKGFERTLELVGVGYRAQAAGTSVKLSLGFSHEVNYQAPTGVTIATPKPTEIVISGVDKQAVGQVAAEIRRHRPPEPYKGKGVKYAGETVRRKEGKKK